MSKFIAFYPHKQELFQTKREAELALEGIFLGCDIDSRIVEVSSEPNLEELAIVAQDCFPNYECRTGHSVASSGDSDHCISQDGEDWTFLIVPQETPIISRVYEGRRTLITFEDGSEIIEIPSAWGYGETEQEAWVSLDIGERECNCGSGEIWTNCTANTQYCG
jgi:hypothetical protein